MNAHSQTSDYEKGPNASCTIRPVLSVVASHLEMVPTNESHLLALCVRIGFGGEVRFSGETCEGQASLVARCREECSWSVASEPDLLRQPRACRSPWGQLRDPPRYRPGLCAGHE